MGNKIISLLILVGCLNICLIGCNKEDTSKTAKKSYIMYNNTLYGISTELPKFYSYENLSEILTHVGNVTEKVSSTELPTENVQA